MSTVPQSSMSIEPIPATRPRRLPVTPLVFIGLGCLFGWLGFKSYHSPDNPLLARPQGPAQTCTLRLADRVVALPVEQSIQDRGRTVTCRDFDGRLVLVYVTP